MNKIICITISICSALIFINIAYSEEQSPRWKYYSTDGAYNDHYYDIKSIVYTKDNIVRVWEKKIATDKSNEVMKTMKDLRELKEIKCSTREYRTHVNLYYESKKEWKIEPTNWESIEPESWMESLYDIVCKKKGNNSSSEKRKTKR